MKKSPPEETQNNLILKYTLKNAFDFHGKANPKAVLGMVLKDDENFKKDVPAVLKEIEKTVKEIATLSPEKIRQRLREIAPELLQEHQETWSGPLKPLPKAVKGKFVVRIAPSPSGPLHIGHAYGVSLNSEYAKMYHGKLILRIEDTNPENIYPPAYELIETDAQWLTGNNVSQVVVQSSRLGIYYDYAEKLIEMNKAYVCTCNADIWRELKNQGKPCPCRNLTLKDNQQRYAKMFGEYAEGEAVLRLKTDITHKNPAMRDFGLMRIVEHVHPKLGKAQRVWPLMVYSVAIDDHELGITHVLNGKDHFDNAIKERMIMEDLGWTPPEYHHWGRINFEGFELSTSKTRLAIEQKQYSGWDDPRLPFLPALRKRGYQPEAFQKFALETGLSSTDKTVSSEEFWKMINSFNKETIEPRANRYFFIDDPVEIKVAGCPEKEVTLDLHPDFPPRGQRQFHINGTFYISQSDFRHLGEEYMHRLMDCVNFELKGNHFRYVSEAYEEYKKAVNKGHIIHWLPVKDPVTVEIVMDTGAIITGKGEKSLQQVKPGEIIQLERRYFARRDIKENNKYKFWYLHK